MKPSAQKVWLHLCYERDATNVRRFIECLPEGKIYIGNAKIKDPFNKVELNEFPQDTFGWVVMMVVFVQGTYILSNEHSQRLVEILKQQSELRQHFLRQRMDKLLVKETWLGIYGTNEWNLLYELPIFREQMENNNENADALVDIHISNKIPFPNNISYLIVALKNVEKNRHLARFIQLNPESFLPLADKDKECIGCLFYCGLLDEDEVLSRMLKVKKSPWTVLSVMAISKTIPTIFKNIQNKNFDNLFVDVPIEELKIWHTYVSKLPNNFLMTYGIPEEIIAHFFPDTINNIDILRDFVHSFKMEKLENLLIFMKGFHSAVGKMLIKEDKMNKSQQLRKTVQYKIFDWVEKLGQHSDRFVYFVLFAIPPYLVKKVINSRNPNPTHLRIVTVNLILKKMLSGKNINLNIDFEINNEFVSTLKKFLNKGEFMFNIISQTGCSKWTIYNFGNIIGPIFPLGFNYNLGIINVLPVDWRATIYITMHNTLINGYNVNIAFSRILEIVMVYRENMIEDVFILAYWLTLLLKYKLISSPEIKNYIMSFPEEWIESLKGTHIPEDIREQIRSLFEKDDNRKLLEICNKEIEQTISDIVPTTEFGLELGKRLRRGKQLEKIAKMQIIKCYVCGEIGGNALAKETMCCRKVLCGSCGIKMHMEKRCVSCEKKCNQLVQINEINIDEILDIIYKK